MMIFASSCDIFLFAHVDGFDGAPMEARKTSGAVVADKRFPIFKANVVHGTNLDTSAATDAGILCDDSSEIVRGVNRRFFDDTIRRIVICFSCLKRR